VAYPFPDGFGGSPKADDEGVLFEAGEVGGVGGHSAAGADDELFAVLEFLDEGGFAIAEVGFSLFGEDPADGLAYDLFDPGIGIEEFEMEGFCDEGADGGLADAHESDQGQVPKGSLGLHVEGIPELMGDGTWILAGLADGRVVGWWGGE